MAKTAKRKRKPASAIAKGDRVVDSSLPAGMSFAEASARAGSFEALLPHLCKGAILARHQGLYTLYVVNAASIAAAGGPIDVRESRQSSVSMLDDPAMDSTTPTAATLVSLWQNNLVGWMAGAVFGAQKLNDNAIAIVENIAWGTGP